MNARSTASAKATSASEHDFPIDAVRAEFPALQPRACRLLHLLRQCRRSTGSPECGGRGEPPPARPQRPARRALREEPGGRSLRRGSARERRRPHQRGSPRRDLLRDERHLVHPPGEPRDRPDPRRAERDRRDRHGPRRQHRHLAAAREGGRDLQVVADARRRNASRRGPSAAPFGPHAHRRVHPHRAFDRVDRRRRRRGEACACRRCRGVHRLRPLRPARRDRRAGLGLRLSRLLRLQDLRSAHGIPVGQVRRA